MNRHKRKRVRIPGAVRDMVQRIVRRFKPEKVILFGSHARGDAGPDSDVDLLVVMEVEGGLREKRFEIHEEVGDVPILFGTVFAQ